ncbi:MAG: choice-of-anchor E domain-containing protein [Gammaproteobacteria bacterium PRO9]|nr:choice-of-anchor E domain-containing protein [Gammaproteobacteria bacterium PRO9]
MPGLDGVCQDPPCFVKLKATIKQKGFKGAESMNRIWNLAVLAGLAATGFGAAAQAASVTYTGTYSGATDVTNQVINVAQFDPALGTLVSASFELSATMATQFSALNDGDFYAAWDKLAYDVSLAGAAPYSSLAISASSAPVRIIGTGTPDGTFAFVSEYQHIVGSPSYTQAGPTLNPDATFNEGPLAAYIGTGNLDFLLTTLNSDVFASAGSQTGGLPNPNTMGIATSILGQVQVTYNYNVIPVPGAVWLFGSALGLVAVIRRRAVPRAS